MAVIKRRMLLSYDEGGRDDSATSTHVDEPPAMGSHQQESSSSAKGEEHTTESSSNGYQCSQLSPSPYQLHLPSSWYTRWSLLLLSCIVPCLVTFLVGNAISYHYASHTSHLHQQFVMQQYYEQQERQTKMETLPLLKELPTPTIQHVQSMDMITDSVDILPESVYTSKYMFGLSHSGIDYSSMFLGLDQKYQQHDGAVNDSELPPAATSTNAKRSGQRRRRQQHPQSHHYRANIPLVTTTSPSKYQLAHTIIDFIQDCKLTMLSYHCYEHTASSSINGITCVGILNERGHITVHSNPERRRLVMDLFYTSPANRANSIGDEIRHNIHHHFGMYSDSSSSSSHTGVLDVDHLHRADFLSLRNQRIPNLVSHAHHEKDVFVVASNTLGNATTTTSAAASRDDLLSSSFSENEAATTTSSREEIDVSTITSTTTTLF